MDSNLLISARKYEKERQWNKAIEVLEQIIDQTHGSCDVEVYVLYAKSLRVMGNTDKAKKILTNGLGHHPKSEGILLEYLELYDSLSDWQASKPIAHSLIEMNFEEADYHFRLGRIYSFLNNFEKAEKAYRNGLRHKHHMPFEKLIEKVQLGFADDPADVSSEYIFINGRNNLGAFTHQYEDKKLFTKISKMRRDTKREETFYKNICSDFPSLNQIVPSYIDSQIIDNIMYLTIEMIDDDIPIKVEHTDKIITTASQVSKIKYQDIIKNYPNPKYLFQLRNRAISVVLFFTKIHKKYYNERLFSSFYKLLEQNNYPESISKAIQKIESLIMNNKLYLFIKPEDHYSLLQGDLIKPNIKLKKKNKTPVIFDWGTFTIGPHFIDIARYLSSRFIPYSDVKKLYLLNDENGGSLSLIEKIFFLYSIALFYILSPSKKTMDERLSDFIMPAINDMELLISEFKENDFIEAVELLSNDKEDEQLKNTELNKQIQTLKKDNRDLETKFNDMLSSRSWKITTPLRKIVEWKIKRKQR